MTIKMQTTTFIVDMPVDYDILSQSFKLVRYTVPQKFRELPKNETNDAFRRIHTAVKALNQPYYFFSYDKPNPGIYVLYRQGDEILPLPLEFLCDDTLPRNLVAFEDLSLHIALKLILASYFKSNRKTEFIHQGKYYIQAHSGKYFVTCLQIELKADKPGAFSQEFKVLGQARKFTRREKDKIKEWHKTKYDYFERMPKGGQMLFRQLAPDEIDNFAGEIYTQFSSSGQKTTLDFHSQLSPERARGKVLYDFINNFVNYLAQYGITVRQKFRDFTEHKPKEANANLPLEKLGDVNLVDIRRNTRAVPIQCYQDLLKRKYPKVDFINAHEIDAHTQLPLLFIQDGNKEDFLDGGLLGRPDPREAAYAAYPNAPKQTINVNPNKAQDFTEPIPYLEYRLICLKKKDAKQNQGKRFDLYFDVCLNQLYLKDLIFNQQKIIGRLPCLDTEDSHLLHYAFIRKQTFEGNSQTVMVYFRDNKLQFVDLAHPDGKKVLYELADELDVDWDAVLDKCIQNHFKKNDNDLKRYDFILGPGQAIEITDIQERVLYEYDEIIRRKRELDTPFPIDELKLAHRYDELRGSNRLPLKELHLLDKLTTKKAQQSQVFLEQLQAFDEFLDELARHRVEISYNVLTSEANMPKIGQIFNIKVGTNGKYSRRKFKGLYQSLGMFLSDKGGDVQLYKGIWYDDDLCFMVGSPDGLNNKQPRAHLIRKFVPYCGEDLFDIQLFMPTMEVKFVRHEQYTVYPYFFHLLDLYVETILMG